MSAEFRYHVEGMTCGHCVQAVTAELAKVPGVREVRVDLASGEVTIVGDAAPPIDAIRGAVDEAGYALAGSHG